MPSVEMNKVLRAARETAEMTRPEVVDRLEDFPCNPITENRLEKIENARIAIQPEDVWALSKCYKDPALCNTYCSKVCPIGVNSEMPEAGSKELSQIALEIISSLGKLQKERQRIADIAVDGKISDDERADFERIQTHLKEIYSTVTSLQMWVENTLEK